MAGKTVEVTDANFEKKVLQSDTPVVVDFWAPWCGPCRAVAPILEDLSVEYEGKLVVAKVNTDENQQWMSKFGITGIPTMIVFKGGQEIGRVTHAEGLHGFLQLVQGEVIHAVNVPGSEGDRRYACWHRFSCNGNDMGQASFSVSCEV